MNIVLRHCPTRNINDRSTSDIMTQLQVLLCGRTVNSLRIVHHAINDKRHSSNIRYRLQLCLWQCSFSNECSSSYCHHCPTRNDRSTSDIITQLLVLLYDKTINSLWIVNWPSIFYFHPRSRDSTIKDGWCITVRNTIPSRMSSTVGDPHCLIP